MKKYLIALLILLVSSQSFAATYYMRGDGTAADKESATSASSAATSMSIATHNGETFAAGDIIYLSDSGGSYGAELLCPSDGSAATTPGRIHYLAVDGETPTITGGGIRSSCIDVNEKDYIYISGITLVAATTWVIDGQGICNGLVIDSCSIDSPGIEIYIGAGTDVRITNNSLTQDSNSAIYFANSVASYVTGAVVSGNTLTGTAASGISAAGFRFTQADGIEVSDNTITDWDTDTISRYSMYFDNVDGITGSNNTVTDSTCQGYVFVTCTLIDIDDWDASGLPNYAHHYLNSTGYVENSDVSGGSVHGITSNQAASDITFTDCTSNNNRNGDVEVHGFVAQNDGSMTLIGGGASLNGGDGANIQGDGSLTVRHGTFNTNGSGHSSSGDGITSHDAATLIAEYNVCSGNFKAGVAVTGTGTARVINNTLYDNYEATVSSNFGIWLDSTGDAVVRNNITWNNEQEIHISSTAIAGAPTLVIDNNNYYSSRGANGYWWNGFIRADLAAFVSAAAGDGYTIDNNSQDTDPLLVSATDLRLQPSSPCIDYGTQAGDVQLIGYQTDGFDGQYYFAPYDLLNAGADQNYSQAATRVSGGKLIENCTLQNGIAFAGAPVGAFPYTFPFQLE